MLKVNDKDTRKTSLMSFQNILPSSSVSVVGIEQVNVYWVVGKISFYKSCFETSLNFKAVFNYRIASKVILVRKF